MEEGECFNSGQLNHNNLPCTKSRGRSAHSEVAKAQLHGVRNEGKSFPNAFPFPNEGERYKGLGFKGANQLWA